MWSPDGSRIAFISDRVGDPQIYVMKADGTEVAKVTNDRDLEGLPMWLPDGNRIAYYSRRTGTLETYVINTDGTSDTNAGDLLNHPEGMDTYRFVWSPDGSRVAYDGRDNATGGIYVVNANGTELTQVADHPGGDYPGAWSPDGGRIAFYSIRGDDRSAQIYTVNADGSGVAKLTFLPYGVRNIAWSPDGSRIAAEVYFGRQQGTSTVDDFSEIYVINADGTGRYQAYLSRGTGTAPRLVARREQDSLPLFRPLLAHGPGHLRDERRRHGLGQPQRARGIRRPPLMVTGRVVSFARKL